MVHFHILSSLAIAAMSEAIHVRMSALQVPSKVAPNYLKLSISSSGLPSMVVMTLELLVLLAITLDFCVVLYHMSLFFQQVCWSDLATPFYYVNVHGDSDSQERSGSAEGC